MDFPNPDYVTLARACGAVGFKAEKPGELRDAVDQALKADGPAIVDCVVPADEMPNFPHVDLEKAENFAKADPRSGSNRTSSLFNCTPPPHPNSSRQHRQNAVRNNR